LRPLYFELSGETVTDLADSDNGISETGSSLSYQRRDAMAPGAAIGLLVRAATNAGQNSPTVNLVTVSYMAASDGWFAAPQPPAAATFHTYC
jgi:hypothetical protein